MATKQRRGKVNKNDPLAALLSNKQMLVAIIAIGAIVLLALFMTGKQPVVGEAISYQEAVAEQAGVFVLDDGGTEGPGIEFSVPVRANLGTSRSTAVRFTMSYDESILTPSGTCAEDIFDVMDADFVVEDEGTEPQSLALVREATCGDGIISFQYVGFCDTPTEADNCPNALEENAMIANVDFVASTTGSAEVDFTQFEVLDLDRERVQLTVQGATLVITETPIVGTGVPIAIDEDVGGTPETTTTTPPAAPAAAPAATPSSGGGGGGGGGGCSPQWDCGEWSLCNLNREQSRTCTDTRCRRADRIQKQACSACEESWICTTWSDCNARDKQTRSCTDEHACGTYDTRPAVEKNCGQVALRTPPPSDIVGELPDVVPPGVAAPAKPGLGMLRTILIIVVGLAVLAAIVLLIIHFRRSRI